MKFPSLPSAALVSLLAILSQTGALAQLEGYWNFDGISTDASGNGLNGTLNNGAGYSTNVPGAIGSGQSLNLDGVDDYFSVVNPGSTVDGLYSVSAWVNPADTSTNTYFSTRRPSDTTFDAKFMGGNRLHGDIGSGGGWIDTTADVNPFNYTPGDWHHVVYNVMPNGYQIYVDGVLSNDESFNANLPRLWSGASHDISIGRYVAGTEQFNGQIDDVAVFAQNLTGAQVASLASGAATPTAVAASAAGKIVNPSFEEDTFNTWPGYINGADNGPITGWGALVTGNAGLNRPGTAINPFSGTSAAPDGDAVAFVQTANFTNGLGTRVNGLTPGEDYRLTFDVNTRAGGAGPVPTVGAMIDTASVSFDVNPKGSDYRTVALNFTATAENVDLLIDSFSPSDRTLLLDNFNLESASTRWDANPWTGDESAGIDGPLVYGYNLGSATDAVLGSATLTGIAGGNPSNADFSTIGYTNGPITHANNLTGGGDGSAILANQFLYGAGNAPVQGLTLNNLTPGTLYHLNLFGVGWPDGNHPNRASTFGLGGDLMTIPEQLFGANNGLSISHSFFASGTSATIDILPTSNASFHLYGFALTIPEPSRAMLLGFGLCAMVLRRRR